MPRRSLDSASDPHPMGGAAQAQRGAGTHAVRCSRVLGCSAWLWGHTGCLYLGTVWVDVVEGGTGHTLPPVTFSGAATGPAFAPKRVWASQSKARPPQLVPALRWMAGPKGPFQSSSPTFPTLEDVWGNRPPGWWLDLWDGGRSRVSRRPSRGTALCVCVCPRGQLFWPGR